MRRSPGSYLRSTWPVTVLFLLALSRQAISVTVGSYYDTLTTDLILEDACANYVSSAYNFEVVPQVLYFGTNTSYYLNTGYSFTMNLQSPGTGRQLFIPAAPVRQSAICCPTGTSVSAWNVTASYNYGYLASLSLQCSNGYKTRAVSLGTFNCPAYAAAEDYTKLDPTSVVTEYTLGGQYSISYNNAIERFLGVGGYAYRQYSAKSYDFTFNCAAGQKVLGIRASPGCASLHNFEILCSRAGSVPVSPSTPGTPGTGTPVSTARPPPPGPTSPTPSATTNPYSPPTPTATATRAPPPQTTTPTPTQTVTPSPTSKPVTPPSLPPSSVNPTPVPGGSIAVGPSGQQNSPGTPGVDAFANQVATGNRSCDSAASAQIAGGATSTTVRYPYALSLRYKNDKGLWIHYCGSSLISEQLVLTAAHCCQLTPTKPSPARFQEAQQANGGKIPEDQAPKVYLGATCIADDGIDSQFIESVLIPSGWTGDITGGNDICIMKMAKPFSLTKAPRDFKLVYPALSNTSSDFDPTSTVAQSYRAIGWGLQIGLQQSTQLREAGLLPLDRDTCKKVFENPTEGSERLPVTINQICTQPTQGNSTCKGDSGGPLIKLNPDKNGPEGDTIVGLVSAGDQSDCGRGKGNTLYTNVVAYNNPVTAGTTADSGQCSPDKLKDGPNSFIQCARQSLLSTTQSTGG